MNLARIQARAIVTCALCFSTVAEAQATPKAAIDQLLAADRGFAASAAQHDLVTALTAMFADSVVLPLPGGKFARTREEAHASLASNPVNRGAHIKWFPAHAGLSADGQHGFTAGYMVMKNDSGTTPLKYLAYWVRTSKGWQVAAYRRSRAAAAVSAATLPFLVPAKLIAPGTDALQIGAHLGSLKWAEQQFSDSAQKVGLGQAFAIFGRDDAINLGGPADTTFVFSAQAIGKSIGAGSPGPRSPVHWSAETALVASSGDLGITFGLIRSNDTTRPGPPAAFFTIWARPGAKGEWRYIAE